MEYVDHSELIGKHAAVLSASQNSWLNYTPEKLKNVFLNKKRSEEGTRLHALASELVQLRIKVAPLKKAFNLFVNDAIGFKMDSEIVLAYSYNCFGTTDAISFKKKHLQIHDLKTGIHKASFTQLNVYVALFCLEYNQDPFKISIEERIYQGSGYEINIPEPEMIRAVMDKIVEFDKVLEQVKLSL